MPPAVLPVAPKPLWRIFVAFMLPMVLSNFLQSLSGTVNGIFIGQLLGVQAMAAAAILFPVVFFFISFIIGLGSGASVLIGQAWGAQQIEKVKAIAGTSLVLGAMFGTCVAMLGWWFAEPMMQLLGTPANILSDAVSYARVTMFALPFIFIFILLTSMLRGVGDTISPLLALVLSTTVGFLVTPALILGWGGLPQLGINSAAWAGIAANWCAMGWLFWRLRNKPFNGRAHPMAPDAEFFRHLRIDPEILRKVASIGLPTGVQMMVVSMAEIALLRFVNAHGSDATAAYGAVNQIVNYVQFPAISVAITCSILGAQSIGAGKPERLGAIVKTGLIINLFSTGGFVLLGYLFSRPIISLFIADPAVVNVAQQLLHVMLWSFLLMGMSGCMSGIMRASGNVLAPTAISIAGILFLEIPAAWWLDKTFGLKGIWLAYPVAFAAMLLAQTSYYHLVWKKRPIRKLI
jgi:putative MATE family efflux protein